MQHTNSINKKIYINIYSGDICKLCQLFQMPATLTCTPCLSHRALGWGWRQWWPFERQRARPDTSPPGSASLWSHSCPSTDLRTVQNSSGQQTSGQGVCISISIDLPAIPCILSPRLLPLRIGGDGPRSLASDLLLQYLFRDARKEDVRNRGKMNYRFQLEWDWTCVWRRSIEFLFLWMLIVTRLLQNRRLSREYLTF